MKGLLWDRYEKKDNKFLDWALSEDKIAKETRHLLSRADVKVPTFLVGASTCGLASGAQEVLDTFYRCEREKGKRADIQVVGCLGYCQEEPMVEIHIPGKAPVVYGKIDAQDAERLFESCAVKKQHVPDLALFSFGNDSNDIPNISEHPFFAKQKRVVLKRCGRFNPLDLSTAIAMGDYKGLHRVLTEMTPDEVVDEMLLSGLKGRGGGGFSTGMKWKFARKSKGDQKYCVMNADEGDPGAFMDRSVLESDPHEAIEGMIIAGYTIGASIGYIYCRAEYPLAIERLKQAMADCREVGILGDNIMGTDFSFDLRIKMGAGAFVCGEETALLASIEGKRGMPKPRPPYPSDAGLWGKPTLINNVETYSNVGFILSEGGAKFAAMGTETSPGTKVFALSGKLKRSGLAEVPMGIPIREIIEGIGGGSGSSEKLKAVQIGGPSGACVPERLWDTPVDYIELKKIGAMMGSGGLVVMDEKTCMVDVAKYFLTFTTKESCGKCTPCREGTSRMKHILENLTTRQGKDEEGGVLGRFSGLLELEKLAKTVKETALCGLGQSAPNPVLSTLEYFRDEYEEHLFEKHCRAGECSALRTYTINPDKCVGCTICKKNCPADAIVGAPKQVHYIIQEKCIGCGACLDACKFGATMVI